jgi:hypothetical protein
VPAANSDVDVTSSFLPRITVGRMVTTSKLGCFSCRNLVVAFSATFLDPVYAVKAFGKPLCGSGTGARSVAGSCH